jgi:ribosomal protein S18 acetylase RimI-like enzyme
MTWTVREARTTDATALGHVHVACWREAYRDLLSAEFLSRLDPVARGEGWMRQLSTARPDESVFVLESGGDLRGFASSGRPHDEDPPRERALYTLYVRASEYGSGAGQALFDAVLGDVPASLWVAEDNPRATAFYRRNGFEFDGVSKQGPRSERLVELRMVR